MVPAQARTYIAITSPLYSDIIFRPCSFSRPPPQASAHTRHARMHGHVRLIGTASSEDPPAPCIVCSIFVCSSTEAPTNQPCCPPQLAGERGHVPTQNQAPVIRDALVQLPGDTSNSAHPTSSPRTPPPLLEQSGLRPDPFATSDRFVLVRTHWSKTHRMTSTPNPLEFCIQTPMWRRSFDTHSAPPPGLLLRRLHCPSSTSLQRTTGVGQIPCCCSSARSLAITVRRSSRWVPQIGHPPNPYTGPSLRR